MPLEIDGIRHYLAGETAAEAGVSRQTLWRWRQEGKVPAGRRFRDRQIAYTAAELDVIRAFANRMEEPPPATGAQLRLFDSPGRPGAS